ncbi:glycoside hydrolase family 99-like domain-containing protein [Nocardioides sp.]|uniref:glycoside hydrolase family 99-like domain-containing protein n=1 Tax=Nocardioides sp. TaxID=35761 RepID=UPI0026347592|nr:glycoside hydrolase family 99-like domain-containing protein [Nocardioides sp.]MDI6910888.1 glycoside hydrolase family 99-like domain-containing protein [Nocardioides sp.]
MDQRDPDDLLEALRAENDELRARISVLEAAAEEYRRQMTAVLTSASWRVSAPLRASAGKLRLLKTRARSMPRRLAGRDRHPVTPTAGLFAPARRRATSGTPHPSPLLERPLVHGARQARLMLEPPPEQAGILVVAHVFYPEVWPDIEDRLARMPEDFDLIVTLAEGPAESLEGRISGRFPRARIHRVANVGRDSWPLVDLARLGAFEGYDAVLKVHTKRSVHRIDGDAWRIELLDGLLPSPEGIRRIVDLMRRDKDVGVVVPTGHLKGPETWGSNHELVEALAARVPFAFDPDALRYPAGSMYWARPWLLQRLADLVLGQEHFESEAGHLDGSTAHAIERFVGVMATAAGLAQLETDEVPSRLHQARRATTPATAPPRVLAFYLPQYHRIPENDQWWGEGFTDWVNVARAKPLYRGHAQPVEPGELGRYDLSDVKVMQQQAELAADHGVDGFVMYHYWFDGRALLDTPLRNLLADPTVDFPFALCWANESWTRRWDGLDQDVLIAQTYPPGWEDAFYDNLLPALKDHRYLRVDGKPLLVVYRIGQLPDAAQTIARWRARAEEDGLGGLHVLAVIPSRDFEGLSGTAADAVDGLVHFPPGSGIGLQSLRDLAPDLDPGHSGDIYSYDAAVDGADLRTTGPHGLRVHPGVMPGWDNTPRRGSAAYAFHRGNPVSFRRWLSRAVDAAAAAGGESLVFVNAWNEWAEGACLEPDGRFGRANLETVRQVTGARSRRPDAGG